jgi:hypothetical protein
MKLKYLLFLLVINSINAQTWQNIGGKEFYNGIIDNDFTYKDYYFENLNEFSPKNYIVVDENSLTWNNNNENIYVFKTSNFVYKGLWVFNTTLKQWKCINEGFSIADSNIGLVAGTKGIASVSNFPGSREKSQTWIDSSGNLWLFSGMVASASIQPHSDLWKYDITTNMWTWVSGEINNTTGNYVDMGIASNNSFPTSRYGGFCWTDNLNNLWLFSGDIYQGSNQYNNIDDVWKYNIDTNQWTWMKGINPNISGYSTAVLGTLGIESPANTPGGNRMYEGSVWKTNNNDVYIRGNSVYLWKYNMTTNNWAIVNNNSSSNYGIQNVENTTNTPPITSNAMTWVDTNNNLWMFGGLYDYVGNSGPKMNYNTLWKYNTTTNKWSWKKGKNPNTILSSFSKNHPGYSGIKGIENALSLPMSRNKGINWIQNNNLFLGYGNNYFYFEKKLLDLWKFDIDTNNFTWIGGRSTVSDIPYFESITQESVYTQPKVRVIANDDLNNLFGFSVVESYNGVLGSNLYNFCKYNKLNDTWQILKYRQALYTEAFDYGTIGIESDTSFPPTNLSNAWFLNNNIYFIAYESSQTFNLDTSFWKFNTLTNKFTCLSHIPSNVGILNIPSATNFPNPSSNKVNFFDIDNNLMTLSNNSIWRYNASSNMWVRIYEFNAQSSSPTLNRTNYLVCADSNNNLWLFGGIINGVGSVNDLWKYDANSNSWNLIKGLPNNKESVSYGVKGISSPTNMPGGRHESYFWYRNNKLWLYGGTGDNLISGNNSLLDLWYYDLNINSWIWVDGYKDTTYSDNRLNYYDNNFPVTTNSNFTWVDDKLFVIDENNSIWNLDIANLPILYNSYTGNVIFDMNQNGCSNVDAKIEFFKLLHTDGNDDGVNFTNNLGQFTIHSINTNFSLTPYFEQQNYFNASPISYINTASSFGNTTNQDFCITANGAHNDLEIILLPTSQARAGFDSNYKIIFKNKGTTAQSGIIDLTFDDSLLDFVSANQAIDNQSTNLLTWNFVNLLPFESREIDVVFNLNSPMETPALNSGDLLNYTTIINGLTDETPNDNTINLNQTVLNSFDPNDKTCLEGTTITLNKVGEYVHYLIRFENNGSAIAQNIVVKDIIDTNKFDINSLFPIKASHNFETRISNTNKVEFIFNNINLPIDDATNDGYVSFKIKTKPNLVIGNTFSNSANIYFDYNFPIETNNYTTIIQNSLDLQENDYLNHIIVYPNPVKDILHFKTEYNIIKIEVYDIVGRIISSNSVEENKVDLRELKTGNYILKLFTEKGILNTKIIKE